MIETYYDINKKQEFEELFKGLYIGDNPTEERNNYLIWKLSFAGIETNLGEEQLREGFYKRVKFSAEGEKVFNSDMVLYFLEEFKNHNKYPMNMIDSNVKTDYGRVNQLALHFKDENGMKVALMTLFGVDGTYMALSEDENNNGYVDIFLRKKIQLEKYTNYEWLIELKYIKESEREKLEEVKAEGLEQLKKYIESKKVKDGFIDEELKKVLLIVVGKKNVYIYN